MESLRRKVSNKITKHYKRSLKAQHICLRSVVVSTDSPLFLWIRPVLLVQYLLYFPELQIMALAVNTLIVRILLLPAYDVYDISSWYEGLLRVSLLTAVQRKKISPLKIRFLL